MFVFFAFPHGPLFKKTKQNKSVEAVMHLIAQFNIVLLYSYKLFFLVKS